MEEKFREMCFSLGGYLSRRSQFLLFIIGRTTEHSMRRPVILSNTWGATYWYWQPALTYHMAIRPHAPKEQMFGLSMVIWEANEGPTVDNLEETSSGNPGNNWGSGDRSESQSGGSIVQQNSKWNFSLKMALKSEDSLGWLKHRHEFFYKSMNCRK